MLYRDEKEKDVEDFCVQDTERRGGKALKFQTPGRVGAPDRIIILPGPRIGWLELKKHDGRIRAGQPRFHAMLKGMGCYVEFAYTRAAVVRCLNEIERLQPLTKLPPFVLDELLR